jgi:hypothetical protein
MSRALAERDCEVTGIDMYPPFAGSGLKEFVQGDLDNCGFPLDAGAFQYILLLDVIEHLRSPEAFADALRASRRQGEDTRVIVSTGNVAFLVTRLMLLLGFFNYGSRGILDLTHTRLFTFATVRNLFEHSGYRIEEIRGVPAPFPLALGNTALARFLVRVNHGLMRISRSLFAYQIFMVVRPLPSLEWLLQQAVETSHTMTQERAAG